MRVPELERPLREVGQALFGAVFAPSAGALFLSSRNEAERAGGKLRIVLRLRAPELAVLPWELIPVVNSRHADRLAWSGSSSRS